MRRLEAEDLNVVVLVNLGPDEGGSAASAMRQSGWCLDRRSIDQRSVASSNSPVWSAEPSLSCRKNRQFLRMSDRAAYPMIVPEAVTSLRAAEGGECSFDVADGGIASITLGAFCPNGNSSWLTSNFAHRASSAAGSTSIVTSTRRLRLPEALLWLAPSSLTREPRARWKSLTTVQSATVFPQVRPSRPSPWGCSWFAPRGAGSCVRSPSSGCRSSIVPRPIGRRGHGWSFLRRCRQSS
jgi:hypothetical protein